MTEGVVVVRHAGVESRIEAGGQWPSACSPPESAPLPVAAGVKSSAGASHPAKSVRSQASDLAEQNDLFAEASSARRRGDVQAALAGFDKLLAKYPTYPLAENAYVERMRLLRSVAPDRAVASARAYLARYPTGFARTEAESLVQSWAP